MIAPVFVEQGVAYAFSRKDSDRIDALVAQYVADRDAKTAAEAVTETVATEAPEATATASQVDYIMTLLDRSAVPFQVVLTKTDKLGPNALKPVIAQVEEVTGSGGQLIGIEPPQPGLRRVQLGGWVGARRR